MRPTKGRVAIVAGMLLASSLMGSPARSASACVGKSAGAMEYLSLKTLHLEIKFLKKSYAIGDTVNVKVNVTRPAKEDPLGNGIPMDRPYVEPASGVTVGVGLMVGRVFLPGAGITDDNGDTIVKIKLEDWAPANTWVDSSIYAWKIVQETPCMTVQEYGHATMPRVFKTLP